MKTTYLFICIFIILALTSCEKSYLNKEVANNPEAIFDQVWKDFDENYSGFAVDHLNWDSVGSHYRNQINASTSQEELWEVLTQMIDELNDEHVKLYNQNNEVFVSGEQHVERTLKQFSLELIAKNYLENVGVVNDYMLYGTIKNTNIGYLFMNAILDEDEQSVAKAIQAMKKAKNIKGLVFDARNCIGGYDQLGAEYASFFANGSHLIYNSQFKKGKHHTDLSSKNPYYTHPASENKFNLPVALLTNRITTSEGEIFTLNMRSFPQVTHFGDTTAGALSIVGPARFLPNGWYYEYSVQLITNPDGSTFEKTGIPPEIVILNQPEDVKNNQDEVLEKATEFLNRY